MRKLGNIILSIGVILFILGGVGIMLGIITKTSSGISTITILSLIFIGAGSSIKKRV